MLRKLEEGDYRFCIGLLPRLSPTHFSVYLASGLSYAITEEGRAIGFIFAFHLWEKMPFIAHFMIEEGKRGEGRGSAALGNGRGRGHRPWPVSCSRRYKRFLRARKDSGSLPSGKRNRNRTKRNRINT